MADQPEHPERPVVVVDTEFTDLDLDKAIPVEVAWWNLDTDERGVFIPRHSVSEVLAHGDPKALEVNGYTERLLLREHDDGTGLARLQGQLMGATLAGSNPSVDARMLGKLMRPVWHHRLLDLSNVAMVELCLPWLPGLFDVCEILPGLPEPDHTAWGDVTCTGMALRLLEKLRMRRRTETVWRARPELTWPYAPSTAENTEKASGS